MTNNIDDIFNNTGGRPGEIKPRPTTYSPPPVTGREAFDINSLTLNQLEANTREKLETERQQDDMLAQNLDQENLINISIARLLNSINNTIIITQQEVLRSQDAETMNTMVNAINAGTKMLATLMEYRKQEQKLKNAKDLESLKHKQAIERLERKAELTSKSGPTALGHPKQQPLLGDKVQVVNFNFGQDQAMVQSLQGKTIEEIAAMQDSLHIKDLDITYEEPDEAPIQMNNN